MAEPLSSRNSVATCGRCGGADRGAGECLVCGNTLTSKAEQLARLENLGSIVADCPGCAVFYKAESPLYVIAPRHEASPRCESGARHHCTCDRCF